METRCAFHVTCVLALFACKMVAAYPREGEGEACSSDKDCVFSMSCKSNKCVCKEGYHLKKDSCLGGIGSLCYYDEECIVDSYCKNHRTCECMDGLKESEDGSQCIGDVVSLGRIMVSSCQENFDCEQYGLAFCETKTNQCQCRVDAHLRGTRCWQTKGLGEECTMTEECFSLENPESMECYKANHTCVCKVGTQLSVDSMRCEGLPDCGNVNLMSLAAIIASYLMAKLLS